MTQMTYHSKRFYPVTAEEVISGYLRCGFDEIGFNGLRHAELRLLFAELSPVVHIIVSSIKKLGDRIIDEEKDYAQKLHDTVAKADVFTMNCNQIFCGVLNEEYKKDLTDWRPMAKVLMYTCGLVMKAVRFKFYERVMDLVKWCNNFILQNQHFKSWIDKMPWEALPNQIHGGFSTANADMKQNVKQNVKQDVKDDLEKKPAVVEGKLSESRQDTKENQELVESKWNNLEIFFNYPPLPKRSIKYTITNKLLGLLDIKYKLRSREILEYKKK